MPGESPVDQAPGVFIGWNCRPETSHVILNPHGSRVFVPGGGLPDSIPDWLNSFVTPTHPQFET